MSCGNSLESVASLLDGRLNAVERAKALSHLESCGACSARYQSTRNLRQSLLEMGHAPVPRALTARLQVLASHERERKLQRFNLAAFASHWTGKAHLCFDNMMRPAFLPVAGGLLFALLMLAWTPILPARAARSSVDDPPVAIFYDKAWSSPMTLSRWLSAQNPKDSSEVVVALTIDGRGRVSDFSLMHGEMTPGLANMILLNRFYPATRFGKPTSGTLVYTFSQVHVKG